MSEMGERQTSMYLFAQPSFLTGVARLVDPFGTLDAYNTFPTEDMADFYALYSDWLAVGDEIRDAVERYNAMLERVS